MINAGQKSERLATCRSVLRRLWNVAVLGIGMLMGWRVPAAIEWQWSHPEPHGNNLADLIVRNGLYVHVTDHGGIYSSSNRVVWRREVSGTLRDLRAATFLGGRLLVTGAEGTVLWSDDATHFEAGILSPATTDWLEGVAAGVDRAVAVGDNGAIFRSTDGKAWERMAIGIFSTWMRGVGFGAGVFVAVGEGGFIATSSDGAAWTQRTSGVTVDLNRVAYGDSRFVVVGMDGLVLLSSDGTTWTRDAASTGSTNALTTVALSPGERLVAGESVLALREPPVGWQNQLSPSVSPSPAPDWSYAASVWDGTRYLIGGRTGVLVESFRTNAVGLSGSTFWFREDDSPRNWLWDAVWLGGTYMAVGDVATILSSPSGVAWTLEAVPGVAADKVLYGVGGSPEIGLAVGDGGLILRSGGGFTNVVMGHELVIGGRTNVVWTTNRVSLMGLVWESVEPPPTSATLQGVGWDGTRFVVVGGDGTVLGSTNATHWTVTKVSGREFLSSVAPIPGGWVASGTKGALYTSPDGVDWTRRSSGTTQWIYRVRRVAGGVIAVGQGGTILTSADGVEWVSRVSGTSSWLTSVTAAGSAVYVGGTQGTVLRSTNLIDWVSIPTLTGKALYGMASRGGQLVVAGAEGVILRTIAEPSFVPVNIGGYRHFREALPPVEALTFEGLPEQRFRWERAAALGGWELEEELELDENGMIVRGREIGEATGFNRAVIPP